MTRVKLCGFREPADVEFALRLGAHALGFVMHPSSPRFVGNRPETLALARTLPPFVESVAVFAAIPEDARLDGFSGVQWTDGVPPQGPAKRLRALRVTPETLISDVVEAASGADAILLDAFHPEAGGGTGLKIDWGLAAEMVQACPKPVVLAGGLTPNNVAEAIRAVRPYAVDVSTGIESAPGVKDPDLMRRFVEAALAEN